MKLLRCMVYLCAASLLRVPGAQGSTLRSNTRIPHHHHQRFLQESDNLREELEAWKNSAAGEEAKAEGIYSENGIMSEEKKLNDDLERFFLTKVAIEAAQEANPDAVFSTDTPFTLMTEEEFSNFVGMSYDAMAPLTDVNVTEDDSPSSALPESTDTPTNDSLSLLNSVDWSTTRCATPVKNQGSCGSCWAFAAVGTLESAYCLQNNQLPSFSEQELTSCERRSYGCNGGWPTSALDYVRNNGGICTSSSYPYTSGNTRWTGSCRSSCSRQSLSIREVVSVRTTESAFLNALNQQAISVLVAAGNNVWKQYRGGVVSQCDTRQLDHAVLAVGYGSTSGQPFFKIKNSWGTNWGDRGYMYLRRSGSSSACGVMQQSAVYPRLA